MNQWCSLKVTKSLEKPEGAVVDGVLLQGGP